MTRLLKLFCITAILFFPASGVLGQEYYLTIPLDNYVVRSLFDHDIPNFIENDNFIRYDGEQWTDGSASRYNCAEGIGPDGNCYDGHNGIDLAASMGTNVLASATGTVSNYFDECGGDTTRLWHSEVGYSTLYAHLSDQLFPNGSTADRFDVIAKSGNSGGPNCTTGAHLHFGVREGQTGGRRADPYGWDPEPGAPVQDDPCEGYSSDLCVNLGYLWTTDPPSLEPPGEDPLPIIPVSGNIRENTTWVSGFVYLIQGSVTVVEGVTLETLPGVIVKFQNTSLALNINGTLFSHGTSDQKIHFTSYKDDTVGGDSNGDGNATSPAPQDWVGIVIGSSGSADISNSVIRYGGRYSYSWCCNGIYYGALRVSGQLTLANSLINENNYGVYRNSGTVNITQSSINQNESYGVYHSGTGTTTAQNSWWGDVSGPYNPNQNPNGTGDRVSDNVEFTPWLLEEPIKRLFSCFFLEFIYTVFIWLYE